MKKLNAAVVTLLLAVAAAIAPLAPASAVVPLDITKVNYAAGSTQGGYHIVLTLVGFEPTNPTVVTVDGTPVTATTSAGSLSFTMPAHAAGSVPIVVNNSSQTDSVSFSVQTASLTPTQGTNGTVMVLTGSGFSADSFVIFGQTYWTADSWTPTQITTTVPGLAAGVMDISVETNQVAFAMGSFTYLGPFQVQGAPTMSTDAWEIGHTVTANPGAWVPTPDSYTYTWVRDGQVVAGNNTNQYVLTGDDVGLTIRVQVTARKTGYAPTSVSTSESVVVDGYDMTAGIPTVSGVSKVGETLTANTGTWLPAGTTFTYQWVNSDGSIPSATNQTYTLAPGDVGDAVSVAVTGHAYGYNVTTSTAAAGTVQPATMTPGTVTISGTAKVGSLLTANPGTWTPSAAFTYVWKRNGMAIGGATSSTYSPVAQDLGASITVTVTGTALGYTSPSATSSAVAVGAGSITSAVPTIAGTAKVGTKLTAGVGTWAPAGVTFAYQWKRNGVAISGATNPTYTVRAADAGATITVTVKGTKSGYTTAYRTSLATATVALGSLTATTPQAVGTAKVGSILTAKIGTWTPTGVTFSYQWKRNGVAISGATAKTYKLTAADSGKKITVTVKGTLTGYTPRYITSPQTATVAP